MWIRQVLIPGITDNKDDLLELKKFINSLKTLEKIELLPYHSIGKYKWDKLGYKYELSIKNRAIILFDRLFIIYFQGKKQIY